MSKPLIRRMQRARPSEARNPAPAARKRRGPLCWMRGLLGRSIRFARHDRQLDAAPSDPDGDYEPPGRARLPAQASARPGSPSPLQPESPTMQQCAELGARLLVHDPATQPVRHLFIVHGELRNGGWPDVGALSTKVIERALTEAEILASDESSPVLASIIEKLRGLKTASDARAIDEALDREWAERQLPEVSDTNFGEYELMERSWVGTVPSGLERPVADSRL